MASVSELLAKHKPAAVGIALALVLTGWLCWYFSDRQAIRRQIISLSWEMSKKNSQESTMETALKMREIKSALAAMCQLIISETHYDESLENDLIILYLNQYRDRYETISVTFDDMKIDLPAKSEAAVQGTVSVRKQEHQGVPKEVSAQVRLVLKKQDGDWLLTQAEIPAVLAE